MAIDNSNLSIIQNFTASLGAAKGKVSTEEDSILFKQAFAKASFELQDGSTDETMQVRLIAVSVSVISLFQRHKDTAIPPAAQGVIKSIEELMEKLLEVFGVDLDSFREQLKNAKSQNLDLDETGERLLVIVFAAISIVHQTDSLSPKAAEEASTQLENIEDHVDALTKFLDQLPSLLGQNDISKAVSDPVAFAAELNKQLLDGLLGESDNSDDKGPFDIFADQISAG